MADLNALVLKQEQLKGQLTRFTHFVANCSEHEDKIIELKVRVEQIEEVLREFHDVQTKIASLNGEESNLLTGADFENAYFGVVAIAKRHISLYENKHGTTHTSKCKICCMVFALIVLCFVLGMLKGLNDIMYHNG